MYHTYFHAVVGFYGKTAKVDDKKYNVIPEQFTINWILEKSLCISKSPNNAHRVTVGAWKSYRSNRKSHLRQVPGGETVHFKIKRVISACCATGSTVIDHCHLNATESIISIIRVLVLLHCTSFLTVLPPSSPVMRSHKIKQAAPQTTVHKPVSCYLWTETGIYGIHVQKPAAPPASRHAELLTGL